MFDLNPGIVIRIKCITLGKTPKAKNFLIK